MEALGAAGSIVGIVSFGLQLAVTLQTHVEAVSEATERLAEIALDVHSTSAAMKQLSDMMEKDAEAPTKLFKDAALHDLTVLAKQCDRVYKTIVFLLTKAKSGDAKGKAPAIKRIDSINIASLSGKLGLGRSLKWPWLEPHIRRCQDQLRQHKMNLLIMLHLSTLAQFQIQHPDGQVDSDAEAEEKNLQAVALELKKKQQESRFMVKEEKSNQKESSRPEHISAHHQPQLQPPLMAMVATHPGFPEQPQLDVAGIVENKPVDSVAVKNLSIETDETQRSLKSQAILEPVDSSVRDQGSWEGWLDRSKAPEEQTAKSKERNRRWKAKLAALFDAPAEKKDQPDAPLAEPEAPRSPSLTKKKDDLDIMAQKVEPAAPPVKQVAIPWSTLSEKKDDTHTRAQENSSAGAKTKMPGAQGDPKPARSSHVLASSESPASSAGKRGLSISRLYHRAVGAVAGGSVEAPWRRKPRQRLEAFFLEVQVGAFPSGAPPKLELSQNDLEAKFHRLFRRNKNGESLLEPYWTMGSGLRPQVDDAIGSVRRSGTEERTLVAISIVDGPFSLASMHKTGYYGATISPRRVSMLMFFRVGAEVEPVIFVDEKGRQHMVPYEHCRTYKLALPALGFTTNSITQPLFDVGDMRIMPCSWESFIKPGCTVNFQGSGNGATSQSGLDRRAVLSGDIDWMSPIPPTEWPTQGTATQPYRFAACGPPPDISRPALHASHPSGFDLATNFAAGEDAWQGRFYPLFSPRSESRRRSSELDPSDSGSLRSYAKVTNSERDSRHTGSRGSDAYARKRDVEQGSQELSRREEREQEMRELEASQRKLVQLKMREEEMREREMREKELRERERRERERREEEMKEQRMREREMRKEKTSEQVLSELEAEEKKAIERKKELEMIERAKKEGEMKERSERARKEEEERDEGLPQISATRPPKRKTALRSSYEIPTLPSLAAPALEQIVDGSLASRFDRPATHLSSEAVAGAFAGPGLYRHSDSDVSSKGNGEEQDDADFQDIDSELEEIIGGSLDSPVENELLSLNMDELVERWTNKAPRSEPKPVGDGLSEPDPK